MSRQKGLEGRSNKKQWVMTVTMMPWRAHDEGRGSDDGGTEAGHAAPGVVTSDDSRLAAWTMGGAARGIIHLVMEWAAGAGA